MDVAGDNGVGGSRRPLEKMHGLLIHGGAGESLGQRVSGILTEDRNGVKRLPVSSWNKLSTPETPCSLSRA